MSHPVMLAIETSQRQGSVAMCDGSGTVIEEPLRETKRHDDDLMPAIDRLVSRCNLSPRDLEAVAVSVGPGGFTGLRIAVTTAKMLAETLGVTLLAVPSALVAAEAYDDRPGPVGMALAGKRSSFWLTIVNRTGTDNSWSITGQPGICESEQADFVGLRAVLADEYFPDAARQRCGLAGVPIVEPRFRATSCLAAGRRLLEAGQTTDLLILAPIYARPPEAVSLWEGRSAGSRGA